MLLVLRTREITDIFNAFDEIYLVFTPKKVNILYIFLKEIDASILSVCKNIIDVYSVAKSESR